MAGADANEENRINKRFLFLRGWKTHCKWKQSWPRVEHKRFEVDGHKRFVVDGHKRAEVDEHKRAEAERSLSLVQSKMFVWSMKWLLERRMRAQLADNDDLGEPSSIVAPERSNRRWRKPKWPRTRQTVDYENGELVITL